MSIVNIRPGDDRWNITDGPIMSPRAGFEISYECPRDISRVIQHAIQQGYLKPVAYILRRELTYESLL